MRDKETQRGPPYGDRDAAEGMLRVGRHRPTVAGLHIELTAFSQHHLSPHYFCSPWRFLVTHHR